MKASKDDWEVRRLKANNGTVTVTIPKRWWQLSARDVLNVPVNMEYHQGKILITLDVGEKDESKERR